MYISFECVDMCFLIGKFREVRKLGSRFGDFICYNYLFFLLGMSFKIICVIRL